MGIPYSKEINTAFEELNKAYGQITPLVESAYDVLETTKNISLLLLGIQILTVTLLALILLALVGILISVNPDLINERREIVTPVVLRVAGLAKISQNRIISGIGLAAIVAGAAGVATLVMRKDRRERPGSEESEKEKDSEEGEGDESGKADEDDGGDKGDETKE